MKIGNFWADDFWAEDFFAEEFWADQFLTPPVPRPAGIKARPTQPYALVEIDMPMCVNTYGVAPCTAVLGGTLTVNITSITIQNFGPGTPYRVTVEVGTPIILTAGQYIEISGVVATGDYDINGTQSVLAVINETTFRVPYNPTKPYGVPIGSYTSGGSFSASLAGAVSQQKCFNTIRTCQDRANFNAEPKTLRFCEPTGDLIFTKDAQPVTVIPSVQNISVTPGVLRPGMNVGQRESVRISFRDHPHTDAGLDKYLDERDYDPFERGTFWAKLRARNRSLEGWKLRVVRGNIGDDLDEADVYHYIVDTIASQGDSVVLSAKDFLILTDMKKAQCPRISNGVLSADLDDVTTSITLLPVGVGDAEYPFSGKVAIGGEEICEFTRVGDEMTLVRGASSTEIDEHDEGDIVQLVKIYPPTPPSDIIYNLLTEFCPDINPEWINAAEWQSEVDQYVGRLYAAEIADPTPVVDLLNELIEQVGLVFWSDPLANKIQLRSLRPVSGGARVYTADQIMPGMKVQEQAALRISEVWTYYGQRNPLESLDEPKNYRAAVATIDAETLQDYAHPAIKKVFSRWIASNNRAAAERLNGVLLARYRDPPRTFAFDLYSTIEEVPTLGAGMALSSWMLQDETGGLQEVPIQITSMEVAEDMFSIDAQEAIFVEQGDLETVKLMFIDDSVLNVNLRTLYDETYLPPVAGDQIRCVVSSTGFVGSVNTTLPSLDAGDWPEGVVLELVVNPSGNIEGAGGNGASRKPDEVSAAQVGGPALRTRFPLKITNLGRIRGGGGGGSLGVGINVAASVEEPPELRAGGGGGGAGYKPGVGGMRGGQVGTPEAGGAGGRFQGTSTTSVGGDGGAPGMAGQHGNSGVTGGAAGVAIDGESFVTWIEEGEIAGGRIN